MRYPNHTLVDVQKHSASTPLTSSWITSYQKAMKDDTHFHKTAHCLRQLSPSNHRYFLATRCTVNKKTPHISLPKLTKQQEIKTNSMLWSLFDINFIKKEKIYTKLKYSRCPQYDIVSGGVAAIFAGFIGFLISEKFGIELVDSGDFYTFFMYCVFFFFSCRPFLKVLSHQKTVWNFFSLKLLVSFLKTLFILIARAVIRFLSRYPLLVTGWGTLSTYISNNNYFLYLYRQFARLVTFLKKYPMKGYETFKW